MDNLQYGEIRNDIIELLQAARAASARSVNALTILLCWTPKLAMPRIAVSTATGRAATRSNDNSAGRIAIAFDAFKSAAA